MSKTMSTTRVSEIMSEKIWSKIGMEHDAYYGTDNHGNALVFARPGAREASQKAGEELAGCRKQLEKARRYLRVGLPEKARQAGVPAGWLRD